MDLGSGGDVVRVLGAGSTRITFAGSEVGNGSSLESSTIAGQDGGLAVRLQAQQGGVPTGPVSRFDDESIAFLADTGGTFDVRDFATGASRGNFFTAIVFGPDVLIGGAGSDTASYEDNQGTAFVNLTLNRGYNNAAEGDTYDGIENLKGGLFDDFFIDDGASNRLEGAMGADTLLGAGGADTFVFTHAPGATSQWGSPNVDTILDFTSGVDKIELNRAVFAGLPAGTLAGSAFVTGPAALDANDRIVYNQVTGQLFYDADGNGAGAAMLFAILDTKPAIAANDFFIV